MSVYANVKCRVFIHDAIPNIETAAVGSMARDIKDHIDSLDATDNKVLSITHTQLRGDRILTVVIGGA
jgi:hypothetical protein